MFSERQIHAAKYIIKNLQIPEQFGPHDHDNMDVEDFIQEQLPSYLKASVDSGVSKVVIIPENFSFVIKIPFNGQFLWVEDDDFSEECFFPYQQALSTGSFDYCARELDLIERAQYFGWGFMVPDMQLLTYINGYPVYIQEKVRCGARGQTSNDSLERARMIDRYYKQGPEDWRAAIIEKYGESIWCNFVDWCYSAPEDYNMLDDLHRSNVGITYDGRPVILDVGGFGD